MNALVRIAAACILTVSGAANAGGPLSVCNNAPLKYPGAGIISLNYDQGPLGNRTKAQVDALVTTAVSLWTNVSTATVTLARGADLPADVTLANFAIYDGPTSFSDGLNPVIYDTDGTIVDDLFGIGAKSSVLGFAGSAFSTTTCQYVEGRAVISGFLSLSDITLGVTLAHEIGHLIGMGHTQLDDTQGLLNSNRPLMYPSVARTSLTLHEDEEAAVSALYPDVTLTNVYGQISGTFVLADGVTAVRGANIWATETTTGKVYSIVSDYLMQNTGFFRLLLPSGIYTLRAEPINTAFTGGSGVGPYSRNATDPSFQSPMYVGGVGGTPLPIVTLGNTTPTTFAMNAGCQATLTFRINGTGTVGGNCAAGLITYLLTVSKSGAGSGIVTSVPAGINCGTTCSVTLANGTSVTLTATPASGSVFVGWTGACSGVGTCTVLMNSARSATATFIVSGGEQFPANCQMPTGFTVPGTAQAGWSVAINDASEGSCGLKSNTITHSQKAQIQFTGNFSAGNISFSRRVSSETGWDCFRFFIDGVAQSVGGTCANIGLVGASGNVPFGTVSVPVTAGSHTLLWSYEKDSADSAGDDAAVIDALVLPVSTGGTLQFTVNTLSVSEAIGTAVLSVSRTGGSSGAAAVNFVTTGNSATAGTDFVAQAGTLNWTDADTAAKSISIPITNDLDVEPSETFSITLSSPTGATLGAPATMTITIVDNDVPMAPGAPTALTATAGNLQATIAFTAPTFNGGSPISSYTATCNPGALTGSAMFSPVTVSSLVNNTVYTCSVTASNNTGTSVASAPVNVTPTSSAVPALVSVVSRKNHTGVGPFDMPVNMFPANPGSVSVEPRSIGNGHIIVFQFNNALTAAGTVSVVDGANATVGASSVASGNNVIVSMPVLADNKRVTFTLANVNGSINPPAVTMGFIVGDINNTRSVNASDIGGVKARVGQTANSANFKFDVNASGTITTSDVSAVKARSGLVLP